MAGTQAPGVLRCLAKRFWASKNSCFPGGGNGNMGTILGKTMENLGNIGKKHLENRKKTLNQQMVKLVVWGIAGLGF